MGRTRVALVALALTAGLAAPITARAQETTKEAAAHFQRAVGLYNEADYHAALVEFKRAYELAPAAAVLYNIGQTYYQLQNYAEALSTFERYLADSGTKSPHRAEVQQSIAVLKTRVGRIDVVSNVEGSEVTIDDEPVGRTPLAKPPNVSVGRRKVRVSAPDHAAVERFVEVAAGDTVPLSVTLEPLGRAEAARAPAGSASGPSATLVTATWLATGVLAAGAVVTGILALNSAAKLSDARNAFPATKSDLDGKQAQTTAFAVTTDVLGAAAIIAGGLAVYFTVKRSGGGGSTRVGIAPNGAVVQGSF